MKATQLISVEQPSGVYPCGVGNTVISNTIDIPGYGDSYTYTLTFDKTYKMCTNTVADPDTMNGETFMLFFKSDGSGAYNVPTISSSTFNPASA